MDIEARIRARIESLLVDHTRNQAELKALPPDGETEQADALEEERDLYQRIINSYRSAVNEVNGLLEEHIGFLSGFYEIVESIKGAQDFHEICSRIVSCLLDSLGAEYSSIVFPATGPATGDGIFLEGVCEGQKILRIHSHDTLLGSQELEVELFKLISESSDSIVIDDIYRESRFQAIDFPGVMRSVVCVPIASKGEVIGGLILSHSLPRFFSSSHLRVLRVLGSMVSHLKLLTCSEEKAAAAPPAPAVRDTGEIPDTYSVVLLEFDWADAFGRRLCLPKDGVRSVRAALRRTLEPKESVLFNEESGLLVLLPGITAAELPKRMTSLRDAFHRWRATQPERLRTARLSVGASTCEGGTDLVGTLEMASHVMHPDQDDNLDVAVSG